MDTSMLTQGIKVFDGVHIHVSTINHDEHIPHKVELVVDTPGNSESCEIMTGSMSYEVGNTNYYSAHEKFVESVVDFAKSLNLALKKGWMKKEDLVEVFTPA